MPPKARGKLPPRVPNPRRRGGGPRVTTYAILPPERRFNMEILVVMHASFCASTPI